MNDNYDGIPLNADVGGQPNTITKTFSEDDNPNKK